jgi:hypothetical protein
MAWSFDAVNERADQGVVDLVVSDVAVELPVERTDGLVFAVLLVAVFVFHLTGEPGVMEHEGVPGLAAVHQPPHRQ